jgi:DNA-binding HxlR family transcriptional regulator
LACRTGLPGQIPGRLWRIALELDGEPGLPAPGADPADWGHWGQVTEVLAVVRANGTWAVPVLVTLASGVSRPGDLLRAINARSRGSLSSKILLETLGRLADNGLVSRMEVTRTVPRETHYWLTREGHALLDKLSRLSEPAPGPARWLASSPEDPPPPGVDVSRPNVARIWNVLCGGKDHFSVDRQAAAASLEVMPSLSEVARLARRFQADAVRRLVIDHGVKQFLDIGTGLPVAGAVHETAQRLAPDARVVYVDNDPQVLAHARALLRSTPDGATAVVGADIREPEAILARAAETLDLDRPVGVVLMMVLHFLDDADDPWRIVRRLMRGLRGDRALIIGHAAADIAPEAQAAAERYNQESPTSVRLRTHGEIARFLTESGLEILHPGLVPIARWWPLETGLPQHANSHVGIGWHPRYPGHALP